MRLSFLQSTLSLLLLLASSSLASPGALTGTIRHGIRPKIQGKRSSTIIKGLIQVRQSGCPGNSHPCDSITCCDAGTICCSDGGCCRDDQYCVFGGCCPLGETCSSDTSDQCTDPSFHLCPDGDGCCAPGKECITDDNLVGRCQGGSEDGGGGATTTHQPTTTSLDIVPLPEPTSSITSSSTSFVAPQSSSPPPAPLAGETASTFDANDQRIVWSTGWSTVTSTCSSNGRRTTIAAESFTVIISSATRIFLNIDCENVLYHVYVNDVKNTFLPVTSSETCIIKQAPFTLNAATNINLTVFIDGTDVPTNGKRQAVNDWSFQLNQILVMKSTSTEGGSQNQGQLPPPIQTPGSASIPRVSWFQGLGALLLVGLGHAF